MVYRSDSVSTAHVFDTAPQLHWMKVAIDWCRALLMSVPVCEK
jgi:hypothetical protein